MPARVTNLKSELLNYGVNSRSRSVHLFGDTATAEHLDYLDLAERHEANGGEPVRPDGVAENQGRPLLFFVNESRLSQSPDEQTAQLTQLRRNLACRGDRAYLARVRPGELLVTPVSLGDRQPDWKIYRAGTPEALTFFSRLALGRIDELTPPDDADFVFNEMFNLLNCGIDRITKRIGWTDVLSLVGRALFFRFLRDRHIVNENDAKAIAPNAGELLACFDNAQNAYDTCQWLDRTFNGEFLPLSQRGSRGYFLGLAEKSRHVFEHLRAIVRGLEPTGAEDYQGRLKLKWSDFDFAHIPVGLLSQVYEKFCWKWDESAREMSVHYTPRNIAATLIEEAFDRLPAPRNARVLDPACGAGVLLVLAFRRLYRERWQADGDRPNTAAIREILEKQIVGFDISDSALKLAALSLYLTAIELDPKPVPPERLRFKQLNDLVLFDHRRTAKDPVTGAVIGSLGAHVGAGFDGRFDVVASNPPWTSISKKDKQLATELNAVSRAIVSRKDESLGKLYENPDSVPDLPFLWKATEWCKPGGRIAMALPARLLFKQGDIARRARDTVFRLIEVTGIVNCSNLRKTRVWPEMDQPFMLLFARNCRPKAGQTLRFVSPHTETTLNSLGEMRIDAKSAQPVEIEKTFSRPWLWKALAVGTSLDIDVVEKLKTAGGRPLQEYWEDDLGLVSSTGYQVKERQTPREDSVFLKVVPDLHRPKQEFVDVPDSRFAVDASRFLKFNRDTLFRSRKRKGDALAVYRAPLALVRASPGVERTAGMALLSLDDIAYNESYYGYSATGHANAELLARYLHLFVHSGLMMHYALLTSAEIGVERPKMQKHDLDECPFVPLDRLTAEQRREVLSLSKRLIREDANVFTEIDAFFGKIYGLNANDLEVIRDTLTVRDPNDELGRRASQPPSSPECVTFRRRLESALRPFFKVLGKEPQVVQWKPADATSTFDAPFAVLLLGVRGELIAEPDAIFRDKVLPLANETGATRIIQQVEGGLLIGLLRQYRYWTPSRARLLGAEILRQHICMFED